MPNIGFKVDVSDLDRFRRELQKLGGDVEKTITGVTHKWGQDTRAALKSTPYPPKRPDQRYVRTGRLANSWSARTANKGKKVIIINSARKDGTYYAQYVVGDNQAWMHEGRWWKARDQVDKRIDEFKQRLSAALSNEISRLSK